MNNNNHDSETITNADERQFLALFRLFGPEAQDLLLRVLAVIAVSRDENPADL